MPDDVPNSNAGEDAANEAVDRLVRDFYVPLVGYLARLMPEDMRRRFDVQDVVQDVYIELVRRRRELPKVPDGERLRWLKTIARNKLVDLRSMHRAQKRSTASTIGEAELENPHASVILALQDLAVYHRTPSQSALSRELVRQLQAAILMLAPDQQRALTLRYSEGKSVPECAKLMQRADAAFRMLCTRGLEALRLALRSQSRIIDPPSDNHGS